MKASGLIVVLLLANLVGGAHSQKQISPAEPVTTIKQQEPPWLQPKSILLEV